MILYPAIDIYDGKCVRLTQGKFDQAKVYYDQPIDAAKRWADLGAEWLHIVDLNGAKEGKPINVKIIEEIMTTIDLPVQIGGGIRTQDGAEIFLTMGAGRVVLGSVVIENRDLVQTLIEEHSERIAVSLDAKEGKVAIHGWEQTSDQDAIALAKNLHEIGVETIIYTDISRDGMMTGPNWDGLKQMIHAAKMNVIASGGISRIEDLEQAKEIGAHGCILGRALYEEKIDFAEALKIDKRS